MMNAKLTCLDYSASPSEIQLGPLPIIIGRSCEANICLDDRWVSRRHCELKHENGVLVVRDLGSKYGTFVNGSQISQINLLPGDMLSVGLSNFVAAYELAADESSIALRGQTEAVDSESVCTPYELVG